MAQLDRAAAQLEELVPGVVAFSVDVARTGVTVTYVGAIPDHPNALAAPRRRRPVPAREGEPVTGDPLDERAWQQAALPDAAPGVRSSLSLPVIDAGTVVAEVVVYGSAETTFTGRCGQVARIFGAWPGGAVSNADLCFDTRRDAAAAPVRLTDLETIDVAAQILARERGLGVSHVRDRMYAAAARAGIAVVRLARLVIDDRDRA
ncbi:MAG: hypothetical protein HOQ18_06400 [Dermatophilaceae bacterium]|nr:hypothetical protein [Dermatophilaceae bacterium]